jgi:repressor LexA
MELTQGETQGEESESFGQTVKIPVIGTAAAGIPILSHENYEGTITLHKSLLNKNKEHFALRIRGDSMTDAGIMDGDMAVIEKQEIVKNGEIAVAVVDEAITLKRFYKENSRIRLQAENPAYKPIYCQDLRILGRLSHIIRSY